MTTTHLRTALAGTADDLLAGTDRLARARRALAYLELAETVRLDRNEDFARDEQAGLVHLLGYIRADLEAAEETQR